MAHLNQITIGADPELFIINKETNEVVSAVGIIPGEKGKPYVGENMPAGFGLEIDNILAEFNIPPTPISSREAFVANIEYMKNYIRDFVKEVNPNYDILCAASCMVPDDQLQTPEAKLFGCSVDYNVYTEEANPKPEGTSTNLRSAGFHIHIGYENPTVATSTTLIRYLDATIGLKSVLIDDDTQRRSLYGKAGCFRICPYGFEYRTLSGALLATPDRVNVVWQEVVRALQWYNYNYDGYLALIPAAEVQRAINNSDQELASRLIRKIRSIEN